MTDEELINKFTVISGRINNLETRFEHYKKLTDPIIAACAKRLDALEVPK